MPYFGLIFLAQIVCAVHVLRTGRSLMWLYLIVFLPALGVAVYFVMEMLPDLTGGARMRRSTGGMVAKISGSAVRQAERQLAIAATVGNQAALAQAYLEAGRTDEALAAFKQALSGIHATEPGMMLGLAQTYFARGEFGEALTTLETSREANPGFRSTDEPLLYARVLEALGRNDEALRAYAALVPSFPGPEGRYRYAVLLRQAGREGEARRILEDICRDYDLSPGHARRLQREWRGLARKQLADWGKG